MSKRFGNWSTKLLQSLAFAALAMAATSQAAYAGVMLTSSRAAIGPGYTVNWGAPAPADLTDLGSSFTQGDVSVSGSNAFTLFNASTFNGDFNPADWVISLFDINAFNPNSGLFRIDFLNPVLSAGAQIQSMGFGTFSGSIRAYDASNILLGFFNVSGANNGNGDGSAVFAGIISDTANISRLEFDGFGDGAGINQLSAATVPEPSTTLLLLGPLAFLAIRRRRDDRATR